MGVCSPYISDTAGRISVVTSTTRPTGSNLYAGKWIYESDTGRTLMYDGTGWVIMSEPAQSFTPTWTNITKGNGTDAVAQYHRSDGWIDFVVDFTFGSTSSVTGTPILTLPVATHSSMRWSQIQFQFYDVSAITFYVGATLSVGVTQVAAGAQNAASGAVAAVSSIAPFTWATGDILMCSGRYRMTTRYS